MAGRLAVDGWRDASALVPPLRNACTDVRVDEASITEASRDWWPLALHWALAGDVAAPASVVCRPADAAEVAAVVRCCHDAGVPVTAAGGRSGVCGASVPLFGGVLADGTSLTTGGFPRQAAGPDLTQLFVGSEGTLGVITGARLRVHPVPPSEWRASFGFPTF